MTKMDNEIKLTDFEGITVEESEKNLILKFQAHMTYEPEDPITVWCSELVEKELKHLEYVFTEIEPNADRERILEYIRKRLKK